MEKLIGKLHLKYTEVLVLAIFFLFSLRVINWFEYPYILTSGDFRPPLVHEAFAKRVLYTWDETDFGMPSVYAPRILDPFYFSVTVFQTLGVSLYESQILAVFLMYFLSSILMYMLVKTITNGNIIASFVAALFLTANIFLINDREVTAIGFIGTALMILPCLTTFAKGIKTRSYNLMAISGMLCALSYATFPNYRTTLTCLIMLCLILLFSSIGNGVHINFHKRISIKLSLSLQSLKLLVTFGIAFLLVSTWVVTIILSNFDVLTAAYEEISTPWFVGGRKIHYVTRLIARWGFDTGALDMPYIPYKDMYLSNPLMIFLSFLPAVIAFASILLSKEQKIIVFFGIVAIVSLVLTSGFSFIEYGDRIYFDLMGLPLLKAFREASNWIFFLIISFSILIGCTISTLCQKLKNKTLQILVICLVATLFLSTSYPLTTGDVARNWLNPNIRGSYLPNSYAEINNMFSSKYWAILLPQRHIYVIYNFSGVPFACGNPYPLIFSKPIISGSGTEYTQSQNLGLINGLYEWIQTDINYRNIAPEGKASASSNETEEYTSDKAIDGQMWTRWASKVGVPQWFEIEWNRTRELLKINIFFESAYAEDYIIEAWNGSDWTTIISEENNTYAQREHPFPQPTATTKIRLFFTKASPFGLVSIWELEVYARTEGVPKFLGMLGVKYLVLEKNIILGNRSSVNELRLHESEHLSLTKEWGEVELFENIYALQKLYAADNLLSYTTIDDMYKVTENLEWNTLNHSAFVNSTSLDDITNKTLIAPKNFVWKEVSPTRYEAHIESNGPFMLVLLQSYSEQWKAYVDGNVIQETNHLKVNGFANGWLIEESGSLIITIECETQNIFIASIIASAIAPASLLMFLSRKDIKKAAHTIKSKFKRKTD